MESGIFMLKQGSIITGKCSEGMWLFPSALNQANSFTRSVEADESLDGWLFFFSCGLWFESHNFQMKSRFLF